MNLLLEGAAVRLGARRALQPLSIRVEAGEQLAVIGPSGAGKTTLLHTLACALRLDAGRLLLDGADPWTLPPRALRGLRARLFLAPQVPPLPPRQRVVTAVQAGRLPHMGLLRSLRNLLHPTALGETEDALAQFDIADKLFARVDRLSGGERQRVGLARALVSQARLLLVDEPLSALDPAHAEQALATLTAAARERGATLVCTLHDIPMALRHFPRVLALREGAQVFDLPAAQVGPARLQSLYDQQPGDLKPAGPAPEWPEPVARPVVHCR